MGKLARVNRSVPLSDDICVALFLHTSYNWLTQDEKL